jgi:hypothetical protein
VSALAVAPASAQTLRQPWYPSFQPAYARVTITNQTDISVVFRTQWPNEEGQRHTLGPGEQVTLETTFVPLTPKPELEVRYRTGGWLRRPHVLSLPSGHVDPATYNPGRVYDFYQQPSNVGPLVTLTAR